MPLPQVGLTINQSQQGSPSRTKEDGVQVGLAEENNNCAKMKSYKSIAALGVSLTHAGGESGAEVWDYSLKHLIQP